MSDTIKPGEQVTKDPSDERVRVFNWDEWMAADAALTDTGVFTVTAVKPRESPVSLEVDEVSLLAGDRKVEFRLKGGRRGTLYNVAHKIVTTETPSQTQERSFFVMVEDL